MTGVLFDLDGCLWYGSRVAPGAPEVVAELRRRGYTVRFLTNASGEDETGLAGKLNRLGIPAEPAQVLAPLTVAHQHPALSGGAKVLTVGRPELAERLAQRGVPVTGDPAQADAVLVGNWRELRFGDLIPAITAIDGGAALVALNMDRRVPTADAVAPGTGAIVNALVTATGAEVQTIGKPTRFFFEKALERFGLNADATVMIGDSPDTDVRGGKAAGMLTVLVGGATPDGEDETPDMRVPDLHSLLQHFSSPKEGVRAV